MTKTNPHVPGNEAASSKGLTDDVRDTATSIADDARTMARDAAETVTSEATGYAERAKSTAADEVEGVAGALRKAASDLREGSPQERTLSQIANGLADASESVRGKDLGEIAEGLNSFARRNPLVFLGGAALVGFAATRFAKASATPASHRTSDETGFDRPPPSTAPRATTPAGMAPKQGETA